MDAGEREIPGLKEQLAMLCERYGDVRVVSVDVTQDRVPGRQMGLWTGERRSGTPWDAADRTIGASRIRHV